MKRVCIVGASGKLGQYMVQHALAKGYQVNAVCRPASVPKLDRFKDNITIYPGYTDDRSVIKEAVKDCDAVLTVLAPWGVKQYSTNTAKAVLELSETRARLIFSCGWHISKDGKDKYSWQLKAFAAVFGTLARLFRIADLSDQVRACNTIFASDRSWTVVRGSDLEEGKSQGVPVWSEHVGDPVLQSNITRRIDFALFMVEAISNPELIQQAPAIVSCQSASAQKWYSAAS